MTHVCLCCSRSRAQQRGVVCGCAAVGASGAARALASVAGRAGVRRGVAPRRHYRSAAAHRHAAPRAYEFLAVINRRATCGAFIPLMCSVSPNNFE